MRIQAGDLTVSETAYIGVGKDSFHERFNGKFDYQPTRSPSANH